MSNIIEQEQTIKKMIQAIHINQIKNHLYFENSIPSSSFNPSDENQQKIISEFTIPISYKVSRDYKFSKKTFKCISSYTLFIYSYNEEEKRYEKMDAISFNRIDDLIIFLANKLNE